MKKVLMILLALALFLSGCQFSSNGHNSQTIKTEIAVNNTASNEKSDSNVVKDKEEISNIDNAKESWKWSFRDNHISLNNLQLYKSIDGGKSWTKVTIPIDKISKETYINAEGIVPFFSENNGWIAWVLPPTLYILKTTDGGLHWENLNFELGQRGEDIAAIQFITPNEGWILTVAHGAGMQINYLLKTTDGGRSWKEINITSDKNYTGLYSAGNFSNMIFYGHDNGWISVSNSISSETIIFKTADGGKTWSKISLPVPKSFKKYCVMSANVPIFTDSENGTLAVEYYGLNNNKPEKHIITYKSNNGGNSWEIAHVE